MKNKFFPEGPKADLSATRMLNGRRINKAEPVMPVTQMAIMRKERKKQEKIDMMAQAFYRGEMLSDINEAMSEGMNGCD